jgi:hypothetical protein
MGQSNGAVINGSISVSYDNGASFLFIINKGYGKHKLFIVLESERERRNRVCIHASNKREKEQSIYISM